MKTKAEIVQDLLDKGHITAQDAVVLLMGSKEKEYVYVPTYPTVPYNPYPPFYTDPFPYRVTCGIASTDISIN